MGFLGRNIILIAGRGGGIVLTIFVLLAIWENPNAANLWIALLVTILMTHAGWRTPFSGALGRYGKGGAKDEWSGSE